MTWPVIVFWLLLGWGALSRGPLLVFLFFGSAAFGSLAVIPVEAIGGVNVLPQPLCAAVIVLRVLADGQMRNRGLAALWDTRALGLIGLFLVVSLLATLFTPRIFAGAVNVVSIAGALDGPKPLAPGSYNLTQAAYLSLSVATVVAFSVLAALPTFDALLARAMVFGGITTCLSGIVAIVTDLAGLSALLEPFRTVSYTLFTDAEALGVRRLVGLMPEASAFGALSVLQGAAIAMVYPCLAGRLRWLAGVTAISLFVMAALSTASTAYLGLAFAAVLLAVNWFRRATAAHVPRRSGMRVEFVALAGLGTVVLGLLLAAPAVFDYAGEMLDLMLFQKTTSDSYMERMLWNETAMDGFFATSGLGVGLGSARASNWFVALLSNTGVAGAALMSAFLVQTLTRRKPLDSPQRAEILIALKFVALLGLALAALVGTSADPGVGAAAIYGAIAGLARPRRQPSPANAVSKRSVVSGAG